VIPIEDDQWLVTLFGLHGDHPPDDPDGLQAFAEAGGRVLVLKEPPQIESRIFFRPPRPESVPMPLAPLVSRFGVSFGNGYLYHMEHYDTNYRNVYVTPASDGELTEGVDRLVFHESTPVHGGTPVLQTTEGTELSETRETGQYSVAVRADNVAVIGDASVFGQAYYRRADNEVFVGNVLEPFPVDLPRVRGESGDDDVRLELPGVLGHRVIVNVARLGIDLVVLDLVELSREIRRVAMGEVATVGQIE
jgi:hypothetical protein